MGKGELAGWLTAATALIVAFIAGRFNIGVSGMARKTSLDTMCLERLKTVEGQLAETRELIVKRDDKIAELQEKIQELREKHMQEMADRIGAKEIAVKQGEEPPG